MVGLAERLDLTRRAARAEIAAPLMIELDTLVAAVRAGKLPPAREATAVKAQARLVAKLHDDFDAVVADACG